MAGARIQLKRATAASWASNNPVLYAGEIGLETDTNKFKIGDGSTAFNSLSYFNGNLTGSSLNDLADVTIVSASNGDFLRWNGSAWINDAVNLSTDTIGSYVESLVAGTGITLSNNSGEGATPTVAIGQDVATSASVTFAHVSAPVTGNVVGNVTGNLTGNADTATELTTARSISLSGDVSGSVSFDGSTNVTITTSVEPNSVALGTDTTGNYVNNIVQGTGVTVSHTPGEGSSASISIGQDVATGASVTFAHVSADVTGDVVGALTGNADTATTLETARVIELSGDVTGSVSFDGSANVNIVTTVVSDGVELGVNTTGNYMVDVVAGTGVTVTHTPGEGSSASIAIGQAVGTTDSPSFAGVTADEIRIGVTAAGEIDTTSGNLTIDSAGGTTTLDDNVVITGNLTVSGSATYVNTEVLTVDDNIILLNSNETGAPSQNAGIEIERGSSDNVELRWNEATDSWEITEDGTTYKNIAVGQDVATTASVTFAVVSAPVLGNATTATNLLTARAISLGGDLSGSASFDGSQNITITAEVQPNSVALGTDTTGYYIASTDAVDGLHVRYIPFADVASYAGEYNNGASYANGDIVSTGVGSPYGTSGQLFIRVSNPGNPGYPPGTASWSAYSHQTSPSEGCLAVFAVDDTIMQVRVADVSNTEIGYLNGVTSAIQTQIDSKAPLDSPTFTGTVTLPDNTVALGSKTTGDYVSSIVAGTGITLSNNSGESATPTVAIGQDVATTASVTFAAVTAPLIGNANTATALQNARTIELSGDVSGSASFDGSSNVTITASVQPNSVALGTDTTGNYMSDLTQGTGVTITHTPGEGSNATIAIGQAVGTSSSVTFAHVSSDVTGDLTGNADTATTLQTARAISLAGDLSGSVSFDGSQNVTITAQVEPNSVALGADTTGNFMSDVVAGTGVSITHTPGESSSASIAIGQAVGTTDNPSFAGLTADGVQIGISNTTEIDTVSGNLTIDSAGGTTTLDDDVVITGTLTVSGSATYVNTEILTVDDNIIVLNNNQTGSPSQNAGIEVERGSSDNVSIRWNETNDSWELTEDGSTYRNIAAGQDVETSSSVSFAAVTAPVIGNASTATTLETARAISLGGDLSGSASFDGSANITITAAVQPNSVALGTDTTGNYMVDLAEGTGVTIVHTPGEGSTASVSIGQSVATSASVTFAHVSAPITGNVTGNVTGDVSGNAGTATTLQNARTISLGGDLSGSASFNGGSDITITAAVQPNSVALGTDTTGNYMSDLTQGTGVTITHTPGEGSNATIAIGQAVGTSSSVTFAHVSAPLTGNVTGDVSGNAGTATALQNARAISLGGDLSGSVSFNGTSDVTITATVQPNSVALGTDTTGNYMSDLTQGTGVTITHTPGEGSNATIAIGQAVGTSSSVTFAAVTAPLVGNASTATTLQNARAISLGGDLSGSASFDGSTDITITAAVQPNSVALGTDTTGNYVSDVTAGTGVTVTHTPGEGSSPTIAIGQAVGTSASVQFAQITTTGNVTIGGDLTVNGTTTTVNTETINLADNIIVLNSNETSAPSQNAGIEVERGSATNVSIRWNETSDKWELTEDGTAYQDIATVAYVDAQSIATLDDIGDVTLTSASAGDFLKWNGSAWVNDPINLGTDTVGNYVSDVVAGNLITVTHTPGEGSSASVAVTNGTAGQIIVANASGVPTWVTESGDVTIDSSGVTAISSGVIIDVDINSSAAIALSKLASGTSAQVIVANSSGVPTYTTLSGDVTISDTGVVSIAANSVALGTDTTGNYMSDVTAGTAISVTHTPGEGSSATIAVTANTFDAFGAASTAASNAATALTNHENDTTNIHGIADTSILVTTTGSQTLTNKTITSPTGLVKGDVGLGNVDNTSDANKPVSTATQTALDLKAPLASPTFTGTVTLPSGTVTSAMILDGTIANADISSSAAIEDTKLATISTASKVSNSATTATSANTASAIVARDASGNFTAGTVTASLTGNASTATTLQTSRTIELTGDVTGSASFNGSANASITATIAANSVALGADTTGDYVATITGGTGVSSTAATSGEGTTHTLSIGQAVGTTDNVTFAGVTADNIKVGVTGANEIDTVSGDLTIDSAGGTVTVDDNLTVTGNLTVSGTTTSINTETLTVDDNFIVLNNNATAAPSENAGVEVERGSSTNVSIRWNETSDKWETTNDGTNYGNIVSTYDTGTVTSAMIADGTIVDADINTSAAITLSKLASGTSAQVVIANSSGVPTYTTLSGDITISDTGVASIAANSVALGTDTTGNYVADVSGGTGITVTHTPGEGSSASVALNATLDDLSNVTVPSPTNGQVLTYSTASSAWIAQDGAAAINSLDDIGDVTITSAASGDFLKWNGSAWVNDPINLGTDTTGDYTASLVAGTGITLANNSGEGATPTVSVDTTVIAPIASPTFTGTVSGITKTMVGLGNVDNTSDANKPVSTATQTALDLKANLASPTFTGTVTLPANTVALGTTTTGDYVASLVAGTGISLTNNSGETATPTVSLNATLDNLSDVSVASPTVGHFLKWDGSAWVAAAAGAASTTTSITANTATTVDSFASASFRSAQFMVTATQGSKYTTIQAIVLHDGTTAQLSQYGIIEIGSPIIPLTLSADILGSDVRLRATITDAASTNATVKVLKTTL